METLYIVLYTVSGVQRVVDFVKTVYSLGRGVPVIVKPIGAAAQIGVPEANRYAYRLNKPLLVLPELRDMVEIFGVDKMYIIHRVGRETTLGEICRKASEYKRVAIVIPGDMEYSKQDLALGEPVNISDLPLDLPSPVITYAVLDKCAVNQAAVSR